MVTSRGKLSAMRVVLSRINQQLYAISTNQRCSGCARKRLLTKCTRGLP